MKMQFQTVPFRVTLFARYMWTVFCVLLTSCAPHLGRSLAITEVPHHFSQSRTPSSWSGLTLAIEPPSILPERSIGAFIDGRFVPVEGPTDSVIGDALRRRIIRAGGDISPTAPVTIASRVNEWQMEVAPGFPTSTAEARAQVIIEVREVTGKVIYRATYSGEAQRTGGYLERGLAEDTMISAMGHALDEIVLDGRLIRSIQDSELTGNRSSSRFGGKEPSPSFDDYRY